MVWYARIFGQIERRRRKGRVLTIFYIDKKLAKKILDKGVTLLYYY